MADRTVPDRDVIARAIARSWVGPGLRYVEDRDYEAADAVMAVLAGQPTVAEAEADVLEAVARWFSTEVANGSSAASLVRKFAHDRQAGRRADVAE